MKKIILFCICLLFIILNGCASNDYIEAYIVNTSYEKGYTETIQKNSYTIIERRHPDVYKTKLYHNGKFYINNYKNVYDICNGNDGKKVKCEYETVKPNGNEDDQFIIITDVIEIIE